MVKIWNQDLSSKFAQKKYHVSTSSESWKVYRHSDRHKVVAKTSLKRNIKVYKACQWNVLFGSFERNRRRSFRCKSWSRWHAWSSYPRIRAHNRCLNQMPLKLKQRNFGVEGERGIIYCAWSLFMPPFTLTNQLQKGLYNLDEINLHAFCIGRAQ